MLLTTLFGKNMNAHYNTSLLPAPVDRQYRRETLTSLNYDLTKELDFLDSFAEENPKNYQIWFHRRSVVEKLNDPSREFSFTARVFLVDAKNYHAWSHRCFLTTIPSVRMHWMIVGCSDSGSSLPLASGPNQSSISYIAYWRYNGALPAPCQVTYKPHKRTY